MTHNSDVCLITRPSVLQETANRVQNKIRLPAKQVPDMGHVRAGAVIIREYLRARKQSGPDLPAILQYIFRESDNNF